MRSLDPQRLNVWLTAGCLALLLAVLAVRLASRAGLPSLLLYLALGLLVGEAGFGVEFDDFQLAQNLSLIALAIILAEGGLTTRLADLRPVLGLSLVLATVGVGISVLVVAGGGYWLLGLDARTALLLGAIVSSTDAAAVFAVLRRLPLRGRLGSALEAESGLNDAPVIVLVMLLASDAWETASPWRLGGLLVYQLIVGALLGLAIARAGQWVLARAALPVAGLYPLATLAIALLAYATASLAAASGIIAVYLAGILLGNSTLPHRRPTLAFSEGAATLAQVGLFVLLGLLATPSRLADAVVPALIAGFVLTFIARPLSVLVCATPFGVPLRDQAFLSWAGLRGAVPIVLTTVPVAAGVAGARDIFDIVFLLVVVYTLIQGPTLPWAARRAGVSAEMDSHEIEIESAPLEEIRADLLEVSVPADSRLVGLWLIDLRLPEGASVVLIVRGDRTATPGPHTAMRAGDRMLIVTTRAARAATEDRLRAVSRAGRLARWLGEGGANVGLTTVPGPEAQIPSATSGSAGRDTARTGRSSRERRPARTS